MIGFTESDEDHEFPEIPEITDISTWSELSKYLTAYHPTSQASFEKMEYVDVHLNCDICQTRRLRLPDWIDSTAYGCGDHDSEDICVLPCGHFFGHSCIRTWMNTNKDGVPSCPKCRFPLLYPECEHEINLRRLHDLRDFAPDDLIAKVPNTRMHILSYDGKTFLDISPEASEIFDAEVNFGVPDECHSCAKHRMLQRWERIRRQRALW
ncbi:hypothetical protein F4860DRAFT_234045 [Xylaria cubensis]|nr:hypothetical protein F4860DRAFT_234045 [Xylaria cubensis]